MNQQVIAVYGTVAIPKAHCRKCHSTAFVIDGRLACCGASFIPAPRKIVRIVPPEWRRKHPTRESRKQILESQGFTCVYCGEAFGATKNQHGREFKLRLEWDHFYPFASTADNRTENFVAACHVCNRLKRDRVFLSIEEASVSLYDERQQKGYNW